MKEVTIYTDGACRGNPGPGGYGAILIYGQHKKTVSGGFRHTTNNRMEMYAVIAGLKALNKSCKVNLYTDSRYISDAVNKGWINKWKLKNWMRTNTDHVKNKDLWIELDEIRNKHQVTFFWVKGHSDNQLNNEVDEIAVLASRETDKLEIDSEFEAENGLFN